MSALILHLSGDADAARASVGAAGSDVMRASELRSPGGAALSRRSALIVVGSPPEDESGWWLAPLLAVSTRARRVTVLDHRSRRGRRMRPGRLLAEALPVVGAQFAALAPALAAQRAAAEALLRLPPVLPGPGRQPRRVVYLRAAVGAGAAVGGSVTHSHEVIRALGSLGVGVQPVTTDWEIAESAAAEHNPPCRWQLVSGSRALRALPATAAVAGDLALLRASVAAARRADFVYQRHARFSLCGALVSRAAGRPLILEYNGSEAWVRDHWQPTPLGAQLERCERAALAAAARILVVSEADRRDLERRGIRPERIVVNPNGVDPDRFDRGGGQAERAALGIPSSAFLVGFVGTFGPWHGVPQLARAFATLAAAEPSARLLLVGTGLENGAVERILAESGVRERAVLTGAVAPARVPQLLDACDALASPHVWKPGSGDFFGSPTKLFEYMAARRPIVASALGQIGVVLEHERSALLVEPGDVDALAAALLRLARDGELGARLAAAAREAACTRHAWRQNAERVLAAYRDATPSAGAGAASDRR